MTLGEIRDRMVKILGQPDRLSFINARLVLRTGISLTNAEAQQHTSDELVRVINALRDMGYTVDRPFARS